MPSRLPVAHVRPLWLRYGAASCFVGLAAAVTWALPSVREHTPFMFFYAAVAASAYIGGIGPGAFAVAASLPLVAVAARAHPAWVSPINDSGFIAVCAVIVWLAHRAVGGMRRERAQREWCEVTLRSVGDAVIVTDAAGRVLTLNRAAEELTGWSEGEALEQPIAKVFEIVNEDTRAVVENPVDRVCREGKVVGLANHTVLLARDGREIPIDDSGAPIWSEDGRVAGAVLVFRDIRERREAERQRTALLEAERAARAEAQAANRAKDEFLAVLSHELRTPLNAILGWSQVVRGGTLPAEAVRGLDVIERNARRQARLIDDVLDVSRIVSGTLSLESAPIDLEQVVEAALDTVRPLLEAKGLALAVRGDCGGPVLGDAHRLQQVVWNLVSNAVKFTPAGGRIEVETGREGPHCRITVRDTGVGIAPEFLPHVFQQFRQEEAGSARRFGGLGLGLTIVRHLVEMHGGSVTATSSGRGEGATFTVYLPLSAEASPAAGARERASAAERPAPRLAGVRVLAVDDEPDARGFTAEVLGRAGAEVRVAGSGAEALQVLKEFPADVLLADVEMPGGDGYDLLRRAREAGHGMPAIAVTAHSSAADRVRVLTAGFRQHVPKPVEAAELLLVVASVVPRGVGASEAAPAGGKPVT
jgi:PAS domain S-box-containing protein